MIFEVFVSLLLFVCTISIIVILNVLFLMSDFISDMHKKYIADKKDERRF
jgi:hypothetical protein